MELDTIAGISTPLGEGGISIIRLSGNEAIKIVDSLFKGKIRLIDAPTHTIHYGYIIENNEIIDEVLISVMRTPRSFTKEDVVEINCHGGLIPVKKILELVLVNGARIAEPGEFTKRAFLNGRIDLSQAEAIIDLIRSKTDRAMKLAMKQVEGKLSIMIKSLRQQLLESLAYIEVTIDYPEHDVEAVTNKFLLTKLNKIQEEIGLLLERSNQGKILREGISTVIVGRPNVGKSSLLNTLIKENKAIVTDVPGTTRDIIEEYINIRGIPLKLVDTAGIRETDDLIERIGVEKSRGALEEADLVLLVFNNNEVISNDDLKLLDLVKGLKTIIVINKTDLPQKLDIGLIKQKLNSDIIFTSITEEIGIDDLEKAISDLFFAGNIKNDDLSYVSNSRHISLLIKAYQSNEESVQAIKSYQPIDIVAIDIKNTWELLGEIIGEAINEDLANQIFSQFCVGK